MPELPEEDFVASLAALAAADARWVPSVPGSSLYLRPFMIATEPFLGVRSAHELEYLLIASPVGPYFAHGFEPVAIWVAQDFHRVGPGGMGAAKTGGNYAASLLPQQEAYEKGFEQVCFLDAATGTHLEELGGMNVFVVDSDGTVRTPALTGTILEGGTRAAILQLLRDAGRTVREETIELVPLLEQIRSGEVVETFACGTAAVITPIGRLAGEGFDVTVADGRPGAVTTELYTTLTDIQYGRRADPHSWMYRLA
jgi:branched-chain amino acid aminotransferase